MERQSETETHSETEEMLAVSSEKKTFLYHFRGKGGCRGV